MSKLRSGRAAPVSDEYDELEELENYIIRTSTNISNRESRGSNIKREEKKTQKMRVEECPECEEKFPDLRSLSRHFDTVHEDSDDESPTPTKVKDIIKVQQDKDESSVKIFKSNYLVTATNIDVNKPQHADLKSKVEVPSKNEVKRKVVVDSKVESKSKAELAQEMKKEIQKRIEENAAKKLLLADVTKSKLVSKEKVESKDVTRSVHQLNSRKSSSAEVLKSGAMNQSMEGRATLSGQSTDTRRSLNTLQQQKSGEKKKVELVSIKKPEHPGAAKLVETLKKLIPATDSISNKDLKLSQLRSLGVSVVKTKDKGIKNGESLNKVSNWMEGLGDDVIEVEDDIIEIKPKKKVLIIRPRYVFDNRIRTIRDVATAKVPGRCEDEFMNSFLAFYHGKRESVAAEVEPIEVSVSVYCRSDVRLKRIHPKLWDISENLEHVEDDKVGDVSQEDLDEDLLLDHIRKNNLPLVKRSPTLSDGNCWYDAAADQVILHDIPNKARDHKSLRADVCRTLLGLPQTPVWIQNIFNNSHKRFRKFIARHKRNGQWTDNNGIMCQATALYLARNIHIVGTANFGHSVGFTKLEATAEAEQYPPLYIGYYQDLHYQSLEEVKQIEHLNEVKQVDHVDKGPESMDVVMSESEVVGIEDIKMDKSDMKENMIAEKEESSASCSIAGVIEDILNKVLERVDQNIKDDILEGSNVKKGCKIMPIRPYKGQVKVLGIPPLEVNHVQPKSKEEIEKLRKSEVKMDMMIQMISSRVKPKPNETRLEIFQNLQKVDTILEFNKYSGGKPLTPRKYKKGKPVRPKKLKPIQHSMGKVITPKKYKVDNSKVKIKEKKINKSLAAVPVPPGPPGPPGPSNTPSRGPPGPPGPLGRTEPRVASEVTVVDDEPPVTHILDVYKCIKCNHAFEKINLFVKHFIKAHKDVINANRNSKSFSFSNFWTKMKVKASAKKKVPERSEPITIPDDEPEKTIAVDPPKPMQTLPIVSFGRNHAPQPESDSEEEFIDDGNEHDLLMDVESVQGNSVRKEKQKPISKDKPTKQLKLLEGEGLKETFIPEVSGSFVWDIEDPEDIEVDKSFKIPSDDDEVPEAFPIDKYQTIPLVEIKIENPFEELPFGWDEETNVLEVDVEVVALKVHDAVECMSDNEEQLILGLATESSVVVESIISRLVRQVEGLYHSKVVEEDVIELFEEQVHDETTNSISHQVYLKDFDWIPLEDQFKDCADADKEDIEMIFEIKKIKCENEQKEAVKKLIMKNENSDKTKDFVRRIIDENCLPEEADHTQSVLATPKTIASEHDYGNKPITKHKGRPVPGYISKLLTKLKSKVSILPFSADAREKKPSFVGIRSVPIKVSQSNIIRVSMGKKHDVEEKKPPLEMLSSGRRIEIIDLSLNDAKIFTKRKYLDEYLAELYSPKIDVNEFNLGNIIAVGDVSTLEIVVVGNGSINEDFKASDWKDANLNPKNDSHQEGDIGNLKDVPKEVEKASGCAEDEEERGESRNGVNYYAENSGDISHCLNKEIKSSEGGMDESKDGVREEKVAADDKLRGPNKSKRGRNKSKFEEAEAAIKKRKLGRDDKIDVGNAPKKIRSVKDSLINEKGLTSVEPTNSFEKLTETSLEETLKCLEDLLENENFTELTETLVEEKSQSKVDGNASFSELHTSKDSYEWNMEKHLDNLREPVVDKSKEVKNEETYESKLERHLNNLREPFVQTSKESSVQLQTVEVLEGALEPLIGLSEYSIKKEPVEDVECIVESTTISQMVDSVVNDEQTKNNDDYNIKQEVVDESYDVTIEAQFRVDEYNIKKEVEDSNEQCSEYNVEYENLLEDKIENGWMAGLGIKEELHLKQERGELQRSWGSINTLEASEDDADDEVMIVDTIVNTSDICDVLDNVIRCEECFKSFQSESELEEHAVMHRKLSVQQFASQRVSGEKIREISGSRLPRIDLVRVSMKNHDYIQNKVVHKINPRVEVSSGSPSDAKKADTIPRITTLQALDDLFAPCKSTKPANIKPKLSKATEAGRQSSAAVKENFLKELDKVFENSSKLGQSFNKEVKLISKTTEVAIVEESKIVLKEERISKPSQSVVNQYPADRSGTSQLKTTTTLSKSRQQKKQQEPLAGNVDVNRKAAKEKEEKSSSAAAQVRRNIPAAYTCQVCLKVNFNTMEALRKHLSYHPHSLCKGKVNICYICDEKFDLEDPSFNVHLVRHLQKMKSSANLKCLGCYSSFEGREKLLSHVLSVHEKNKSFPCPVCPKYFDRKRQLLLHITTIHEATSRDIIEKET